MSVQLFKRFFNFEKCLMGIAEDMVIFEFENNGHRQWSSRGGTRNAGNGVLPNIFLA